MRAVRVAKSLLALSVALSVAGVAWQSASGQNSAQNKADVLKTDAWKIPSPATAEHPGAKEAPAASPTSYPDEAGFQKRADTLVAGLATANFNSWRSGYFASGGDPAKYVIGPAMAKLVADPKADDALKIMNDNRTPKEQYHFACVGWSRFYPLFSAALTPETKQLFATSAGKAGSYLSPNGTENHCTMWMTSSNVLPLYIEGNRFSNNSKDNALKQAKEMLRHYVKGIYAAGQGEWDSSTYLMFDVNGMLNIYDFAKDPEVRLLAKAALDWYSTAYALKYTDGVYCAPNQRGYAGGPARAIADQTGWLWWGSRATVGPERTRGFLYAMHPATSAWRPNGVITHIATRQLPNLPFESRDTKPSYWGIKGTPRPGVWDETVYVSKAYTMGSLQKGFGGQTMRFMVAAASDQGGQVFTAASPTGRNDGDGSMQFGKFDDGNGMFDQTAQVGGTFVLMFKDPGQAYVKEFAAKWAQRSTEKGKAADPGQTGTDWAAKQAESQYVFFLFPPTLKPTASGDWQVFQAGDTFVAVRGIAGKGELASTPGGKKGEGEGEPILKFPGARSGVIVETGDTSQYKSAADFAAALAKTSLDASKFDADLSVTYTALSGKKIQMQYQGNDGGTRAAIQVDGKDLAAGDAVYDNPYIHHKDGVLSVNDGKDGFVVDFTGDLPVYKPWKK